MILLPKMGVRPVSWAGPAPTVPFCGGYLIGFSALTLMFAKETAQCTYR